MPKARQPIVSGSGGGAVAGDAVDERRQTVARFRIEPDPRRLRELLAEVDTGLGSVDALLRRRVRLLVGEIVARVLRACPGAGLYLDLELKADSVRVDLIQRSGEKCDFWSSLDEVVFSDLTTAWGRDRRRPGGAWFEIDARS